jgi:hypothetical protein
MKINFFCDSHLVDVIPRPIPAIKAAPDYFKAIKPQSNSNPISGTVKRCVPVIDALSAGFIIPMWCDVFVSASNNDLRIDFPPSFPQEGTLDRHSEAQIPNHPLSKNPYGNLPLKWVNPWVIETEPGVSCIFTSPLNHMETRFKLIDGVVDTDTYYNAVNFPFLWTGGHGDFFIPKGTPLVQVIPFRREEQSMEVAAIDVQRKNKVVSILGTKIKNAYREELWHGRKVEKINEESEAQSPSENFDPTPLTEEAGQHAAPKKDEHDLPLVLHKPLTDGEILHQDGYVIIRNLITQADADQVAQKLREYIEQTNAQPDDLCPKSQAVHSMPASDELLEILTPAISKASGKNLIPTYSYARMYVNGETLPKHADRPACQYSVTLCLGMDGDPWPIFIAKTEEDVGGSVSLNVGDGVLYLGMDMYHWREPFEGQWQAQVFLHWVDADGPHADQRYDGRLDLSHNIATPEIDDNVIPLSTSNSMSSGILEVTADDAGRGFGEGDF